MKFVKMQMLYCLVQLAVRNGTTTPKELRPETGLLGIRKALGLFSNIRPAIVFDCLKEASTLKPEVLEGTDLIVVRELTGGIYFGEKFRRESAQR